MLQRLIPPSLFLILLLLLCVSMVGVDEAQAADVNPPDYFWNFSTRNNFTALWQDPDHAFAWFTQHYNIRYRKQGDTSWTELSNKIVQGGSHGGGKITIPDLTPNTTYEYQARTHAATLFVSKTSDWSSTQTAKTKANGAPTTVGSIPAQAKVEAAVLTVNVSSYFSDPESDTLTYTATSSDTSIATVSVSGAKVNVSTLVPGSATITVTATDPFSATATQTIEVTVTPNQAPQPVGTLPDQTLKIGSNENAILNVSAAFSDPDGHTMTYSASSSDTSVATVILSDSTLVTTLIISSVAAGSATITVTATDSLDATGTQTCAVTVEANTPPVTVGTIPDQTVSGTGSAATVDLNSYFDDPDAPPHLINPLTYTVTSSDTSIAAVSLADSTLTITAVVAGSATITVTATDTASATATQTFSVTVVTNQAPVPVGTIPTQTLGVGGTAATVDMSPYFSDPDGNSLTYIARAADTSIVTVTRSGSTFTITPVAAGSTTITVQASDDSNASVTQTFSVNVVSNRTPIRVGSIPEQLVRIGESAATLDVSSYFSDPDGHTLTYSATSSNTNKATVSMSDATLTITAGTAGTATITVRATDTGNASTTQSFSVTVLASDTVNPVGSIPSQSVALSGSGTATVDVSSYFSGPVGETLTYTATSSNTSRATVSVSDATVTITGVAAGSATISVQAADTNNASATQTFSVTVYSNRAPITVGTIPTLQIAQTWNEQFDVSSYFSDPDGNTLTYAASSSDDTIADAGISSTDNSAVYVFGNGVGTATVTVTATDPSDATATQTFSVEVGTEVHQADAVPGLSSTEQLLLGRLLTYDTLIFNELHNGSDDANDWLELRNVSNIDIPLENWQLTVQTGSGTAVIPFPAGTVISAGEVLLITNTAIAPAAVVVKTFALPQTAFALILRSPTAFGDLAGNYFQTQRERPETAPELTVDTVWERVQAATSGYRAEAWAASTHHNGLGSPGYQPSALAGDLNHDGVVNILDLVLVASQFGTTGITAADLNGDNTVNIQDLVLVANASSNVSAAPTATQSAAGVVNTWLRLARQNAARGVETAIPKGFSYARGIQVLEQLVRALTPDTTALLANYPNPFNPETWIPYQLAKPADVTVTIYASDGSVVRTLALGHQDVGKYHTRSQAAYWDGRNEFGETVASGVYFYTLTAGEFAATRKMLILK